MANSKAIRADDGSGLNIATVSFTEGAETRHAQQVTLVDSSTPTQKLAIDSSGNVAVKAAANSGVDVGDVTINNASGASAVNVQDGGNSITVDGTFWQTTQPVSAASLPLPTGAATAAKQPALGTAGSSSSDVISVQGIASGTALPVSGTFWQSTQPVSAASLPLPTGASTSAKQPALGTAGSASTDVISVQGIASGTPLSVQLASTLGITIQSVGIAASSSGDNTIISAQGTGKKIYVFAWSLSFSGTVNAKFTDATIGLQDGLYYGIANSGAGASVDAPAFLFVGTANTALVLNLSASVAVGGRVSYFVI